MHLYKKGIVLTDPDKHILFSVQGANMKVKVNVLIMKDKVFIGGGKQGSLDETANKTSISQPCDIAVQFEKVVYLTNLQNDTK